MNSCVTPDWATTRISINIFKEITPYRGHPPAIQAEYQHAIDVAYYSTLFLPIHALTHLDFPWREAGVDPQLVESYSQPVTLPTIILNLTDHKDVLTPYLIQRNHSFLTSGEPYPQLDIGHIVDGESLWLLIQELEITKEQIQTKLEILGQPDLDGSLLLFWTDWSSFNPYEANFNHPALEGTAAYLCHPYLTRATLEWLIGQGCIGLGHDMPSLENPLFYAKSAGVHPLTRDAREVAHTEFVIREGYEGHNPLKERTVFNYFLKIGGSLGELEPRRYYLRNLRMDSINDNPISTTGNCTIVPIPVLKDRAAVVCEVYFQEGE